MLSHVANLRQILYLFQAWENCDTAAAFGASLWQSDTAFSSLTFFFKSKSKL
jgi:hypothetical protein